MKLKLLLLSAVTAAFLAPAAHAATVTLGDSYVFNGADSTNFTTTFAAGSQPTTTYYELVNASGLDMNAKVILGDTDPTNGLSASYALYTDTDTSVNSSNTDAVVVSDTFLTDISVENNLPFLTFVMQAGQQYVLALTTDTSISAITTSVSAVPLPGAIWLFGSALLGFLGFSNRRKI